MIELQPLADRLHAAQSQCQPCDALTTTHPDLTLDDAYAIQQLNIKRLLQDGARKTGRKIGITSLAVMKWLNVGEPDYGTLFDSMCVTDGGEAPMSRLLQPRVEGEVAFVLKQGLQGPGLTISDVLQATAFILPAIEIIDSRIRDWKIKIQDTVADNASCAMYVLGAAPTDLKGLDLRLAGMTLRKNGDVVSSGAGAACLGHPATAVLWLANELGRRGVALDEGDVIMSGALGPVAPVTAGDYVEVQINSLGSVRVRFT